MITLGLRFQRRDAVTLRLVAERIRQGDMSGQAVNVFEQAAIAAESGEPLVLHCDEPLEAVQMAVAYAQFGVTAPVIEELNRA